MANSLKNTKLAQLLADHKTLLFFSSDDMKETGIMASPRNREEQNTQPFKTIFCGYGLTNLQLDLSAWFIYFEAEQNAIFSF